MKFNLLLHRMVFKEDDKVQFLWKEVTHDNHMEMVRYNQEPIITIQYWSNFWKGRVDTKSWNLQRYELTWQAPWTLQSCPLGDHQMKTFSGSANPLSEPPWSHPASTIRLFRRKSEVMLVALVLREVDDEWCVHKDKQTHIHTCKQTLTNTP